MIKKIKKENKFYVVYKFGFYFSEESLIVVNWIWLYFWGFFLDYIYYGMCIEELKVVVSFG